MRATVLVVAKAPVPGLAKTRLVPALGPRGAAEVAAAALLDTLDAATAAGRALGVRPVVALTGDLTAAARADHVRAALARCTVVPQRGDGFDERLAHAHVDAAGAGPVVQIGMDTPQVTAELLMECADALTRADAALGAAEDGGWWMLALRDAREAMRLVGVPMSTPETGAATAAALRRGGLSVAEAPPLRDVDTAEDAWAVADLAPMTRFAVALAGPGRAEAVRPASEVGAR
ncbi:DUF2064 domain-containing protein [Spongisporangium articulatum]|uniref:DUF2064 domain-containing protein n=1 Tax=Spongisporangium articulatum TaxID=3362603 RepID=A0ABW8ARF2_9ACTN